MIGRFRIPTGNSSATVDWALCERPLPANTIEKLAYCFVLDFVEVNLQGSDLTGSRRERAARLLGEIFGVCRDPFVSKMRYAAQRASKISRLGQIGVFQQYRRVRAVLRLWVRATGFGRSGRRFVLWRFDLEFRW